MKRYLLLLCLSCCYAVEPDWNTRLQALRVISDPVLAVQAADEALSQSPSDKRTMELAIMLYADAGEHERLFQTYHQYQALYPQLNRDLIEEMAWGVIEKGSQSSAPITRIIALIAGAMSNDARGIKILAKAHHDSNRLVRLLAAEFSCHFRDAPLQEIIFQRMRLEKDYAIRLTLIKGCGKMGLKEAEPFLMDVVSNERSRAEEKVAAIASLVALKESAGRKEVEAFVQSPRAGLRMLGAELLRYNDRKEDEDLLLQLLKDDHPDVKAQAIETAGLLRMKPASLEELEVWGKDLNAEIAVRSAWWLTMNDGERGQRLFAPFLKSEKAHDRLLAAAFLAKTGKYGFPLTAQAFQDTKDPFVALSLAVALVQERNHEQSGLAYINLFLQNNKERLCRCNSGIADWIAPAVNAENSDLVNLKEATNQLIRLELINVLAVEGFPDALLAIEALLKERSWGITGVASSLLLTEGEPEAVDLIRELLKDPSDKVKLQAALVLGNWGRSPEALDTLESLYSRVNREQKEQILETLGNIGDSRSLPFLVKRMNEHQQVIRMIAAASVIKTLYH